MFCGGCQTNGYLKGCHTLTLNYQDTQQDDLSANVDANMVVVLVTMVAMMTVMTMVTIILTLSTRRNDDGDVGDDGGSDGDARNDCSGVGNRACTNARMVVIMMVRMTVMVVIMVVAQFLMMIGMQ